MIIPSKRSALGIGCKGSHQRYSDGPALHLADTFSGQELIGHGKGGKNVPVKNQAARPLTLEMKTKSFQKNDHLRN
jgi:hypothetical protein